MGSPVKVFNQSFSCLYPIVLPTVLDFINGEEYLVDFTELIDKKAIDFISSVWVDLVGKAYSLQLHSNVCNQIIYCSAGKVTTMPLFLGNAPKVQAVVSVPINDTVEIIFSNIPFFPFVQTP